MSVAAAQYIRKLEWCKRPRPYKQPKEQPLEPVLTDEQIMDEFLRSIHEGREPSWLQTTSADGGRL